MRRDPTATMPTLGTIPAPTPQRPPPPPPPLVPPAECAATIWEDCASPDGLFPQGYPPTLPWYRRNTIWTGGMWEPPTCATKSACPPPRLPRNGDGPLDADAGAAALSLNNVVNVEKMPPHYAVARRDGLHLYLPEEKVSVCPIDGNKIAACSLPPPPVVYLRRPVRPPLSREVLLLRRNGATGRRAARGRPTRWSRRPIPNRAAMSWTSTTRQTSSWGFMCCSCRDIRPCAPSGCSPCPPSEAREEVEWEEWARRPCRSSAGDDPTRWSSRPGVRLSPSRKRRLPIASTCWCRRICTPRQSLWHLVTRNSTVPRISRPCIGSRRSTYTAKGTLPLRWFSIY
mmetsp:Transcript_41527/g.87107  ORF Transcript_41527/g.87107 Transcript_41527/m.87107 type:complete len:342 (+) Transcript_41527:226-1251(+)